MVKFRRHFQIIMRLRVPGDGIYITNRTCIVVMDVALTSHIRIVMSILNNNVIH